MKGKDLAFNRQPSSADSDKSSLKRVIMLMGDDVNSARFGMIGTNTPSDASSHGNLADYNNIGPIKIVEADSDKLKKSTDEKSNPGEVSYLSGLTDFIKFDEK